MADPLAALDRAQLDWVLWAPLGLGTGVGLYFLLPFEPGVPVFAAAAAVIVLAVLCGCAARASCTCPRRFW
ncbi:hypothetical protein ACTTAI_07990 [Rhodobacter capsulatus]|uniref:hypothetical protein n=1 Tax=Rhodobacter capsulatus TaxID=1061 RepID=UPI00402548AF